MGKATNYDQDVLGPYTPLEHNKPWLNRLLIRRLSFLIRLKSGLQALGLPRPRALLKKIHS